MLAALGSIPGLHLYGLTDENYYALNVSERLGVEERGGMVRVGVAHYSTLEQAERLKESLLKIATG